MVRLSGEAFASVVTDARDNPVIRETERYFWGNTSAAAQRVKKAKS